MSQVGIKERRVSAIVTATSADGLRWQIVATGPPTPAVNASK